LGERDVLADIASQMEGARSQGNLTNGRQIEGIIKNFANLLPIYTAMTIMGD
jgi:hypothetical protein